MSEPNKSPTRVPAVKAGLSNISLYHAFLATLAQMHFDKEPPIASVDGLLQRIQHTYPATTAEPLQALMLEAMFCTAKQAYQKTLKNYSDTDISHLSTQYAHIDRVCIDLQSIKIAYQAMHLLMQYPGKKNPPLYQSLQKMLSLIQSQMHQQRSGWGKLKRLFLA